MAIVNKIITPKSIHKWVSELITTIGVKSAPVYVNVEIEKGSKDKDCFENVRKKIEKDGGTIVYGWAIWEYPGIFMEAEFHSVWKKPDSSLLDVTPRSRVDITQILFVEDQNTKYDGAQVNNVRIPISHNQHIIDWIRLEDEYFVMMNKGERSKMVGDISSTFTDYEFAEYKRLVVAKELALRRIIGDNPARNDICRCGSNMKYKKCCDR